ncbi:MAG: hypothetical protein A3F68_01980 [Acidobacteria bacterium RIFCSPLOWO2_12_FULL_54_10]|nr:MAG: hypothetical protein A3F68_01980 [Acidobacteria bacterium RIFCSPLOWO2_12_FULL_54_10]
MNFLGLRTQSAWSFSGWNGDSRLRLRLRSALLILIMLNAVLIALLLRPPGQTAISLQRRFETSQETLTQARNAVTQMRSLQQKLEGALDNGQGFVDENFLPRGAAFSTVVADLYQLADESGLESAGIKYTLADKDTQPGWTNMEVNITVAGDYASLIGFINQLEQSPVLWLIQGISVNGDSRQGLQLNLVMQTYFISTPGRTG